MVSLETGDFHKKRNLLDILIGKKSHQDRLGSHLQVGIDESRGGGAGFKEPIDFVITEQIVNDFFRILCVKTGLELPGDFAGRINIRVHGDVVKKKSAVA